MNYLATFSMLGLLTLTSCAKSELDSQLSPNLPVQACRVTQIDPGLGGANNRTFDYNKAGQITKMTLAFRQVNTTNTIRLEEYRFTYDAKNQLTEAKIAIDGQPPIEPIYYGIGDTETYVWANGQLTQIVSTLQGHPLARTSLTYDAQHRLIRAKTVPVPLDQAPYESIYSYDGQGNYTCLSLLDGQPDLYEEFFADPVIKSVESLLPAHGLPYDVFAFKPWKTVILSEYRGYSFNEAGEKVLDYSYKTTAHTQTSQQVVTSQQVEDNNGKRMILFSLTDCQ